MEEIWLCSAVMEFVFTWISSFFMILWQPSCSFYNAKHNHEDKYRKVDNDGNNELVCKKNRQQIFCAKNRDISILSNFYSKATLQTAAIIHTVPIVHIVNKQVDGCSENFTVEYDYIPRTLFWVCYIWTEILVKLLPQHCTPLASTQYKNQRTERKTTHRRDSCWQDDLGWPTHAEAIEPVCVCVKCFCTARSTPSTTVGHRTSRHIIR